MRKVCLVASDILGVITNSGIATATTHLAFVLAQHGNEVTILNTGHLQKVDDLWKSRYGQAGVTIEHLDRSPRVSPEYIQETYLIYQHLKPRHFDVVVFQDWLGPPFASICAKRAGVAFDTTHLVIVTHGPTEWVREANQELKLTAADLAVSHMERVAIEGADTIVGPSAYLHQWMLDRGWQLPDRLAPVPNFTAGHAADLGGIPELRSVRGERPAEVPLKELVFFGRLEHRKGVLLYARALNLLDPDLLDGFGITFLGREAHYTETDVLALLSIEVRSKANVRFLTTLDQEEARRYLREPGRVAVMPSLDENSPGTVCECVEDGIPFIASHVGGIGELVDEQDHERCLFNPQPASLAGLLTHLLSSPSELPRARPAFDGSASLAAWVEILNKEVPPRPRLATQPLASVVIPHHDRPALLTSLLESLESQDYSNFEVVVVDDGSEQANTHAQLKDLEDRGWSYPLQVVRQDNKFLGAARNTGVRHANGDLLLFIDDDDVARPGFVASMVRAIDATGAAAVSCAFVMFEDEEGPPTAETGTWAFLGGNLALGATGNHLGGAGVIMRRDAWEAVGGYHENFGHGLEDWDILVRLLMAGFEVFALPEPVYGYRVLRSSMRITMNRYQSQQIVLDRYRDLLPENLRVLVDLVHGQSLEAGRSSGYAELLHELDRRQRYQWMLERRIALLERERRASIPSEKSKRSWLMGLVRALRGHSANGE